MHGKAYDLVGNAVADGQTITGEWIGSIGGLPMKGLRVINGGRDSACLEPRRERVASVCRQPDCVLRPYRGCILHHLWHMAYARQVLVVADGYPLAAFDLLREDAQFFQLNRGLQCVEASVKADSYVVVLV